MVEAVVEVAVVVGGGGAARLCEHPVPLDLAVEQLHDLLLHLLALPVDPRFLLGALAHRRRLEALASRALRLRLRLRERVLLLRQHL